MTSRANVRLPTLSVFRNWSRLLTVYPCYYLLLPAGQRVRRGGRRGEGQAEDSRGEDSRGEERRGEERRGEERRAECPPERRQQFLNPYVVLPILGFLRDLCDRRVFTRHTKHHHGIQVISNYKPINPSPPSNDISFLNELNNFYARFEKDNHEQASKYAYRKNRSTEDAVSTALHFVLSHLDNNDTYARMLFIDFSPAFNTVIPSKLEEDGRRTGSVCDIAVSRLQTLPKFTQYVTCYTRDNKTLDLFYANTKEAYHSLPLPPLGCVDHNLVHLQPVYKPLVQRQPAVTRRVKKWSEEAEEALKDCFNTTLWDVFSDAHGGDIDNLTNCITDYINFCVENTEKKRAFVSGDKEELKTLQRELRRKIRQEKDNYRRKMENQLQQNNIYGIWKGLKTISGFKEQKSQPVGDRGWANDLNLFFNRFDQVRTPPPAQSPLLLPPPLSVPPIHCSSCPPSPSLMNFSSHIPDTSHSGPCPSPPPTPPCSSLSLTPHQVRKALKKNRARKATGPDGISSRLLKSCADQLCGIFSHMFNLSLKLGRVPQLWKTSCIVALPKTLHPKEVNSYRPVALTSHLMKTLERLILDHLRPLVSSFMDPLQFAYQPSIGVDSAVIYLLHTSLAHLEKAGSTVRIMFFDFSSAFSTIQPRLLGDKLQVAGVNHHLRTWILDYLTQRPQFVRVKGSESDRLLCSTGVPQGTVLAPFLFTLYTTDFSHSTSSCHLQKFSDDSAAVGLIADGDDTEYRELIQGFVDWSLRNNLQINAGKTKELVVDFRRRNNPLPAAVNILGTDVDVVESYKYLGVHLNNNLDWTHNTDALVKKGNNRLFLLRRLRSFGVQGPLLRTFYDSVVGSAIFCGIVCWSSSITDRDRRRWTGKEGQLCPGMSPGLSGGGGKRKDDG
ncbi:RNA-directed DNA polymerase from mobile element jockey [Takifugu flavidus]|uniref:RNA-directed DNA polymerase from mobile element jockey n=1 Tax=Takifugu flavidus TaxID=433684 RepID=A0A5C6MN35_9TELE|nr:RNA-directed DNA polymerase from mobile element jockey [Takifugu flavidus]